MSIDAHLSRLKTQDYPLKDFYLNPTTPIFLVQQNT